MTLTSYSSSEADTPPPVYLSPVSLHPIGSHTPTVWSCLLHNNNDTPNREQTLAQRCMFQCKHKINSRVETFSYRGLKNKYVCNPTTIGTTQTVDPADSIGSPRKIPNSSAFQRNKEQTSGHATITQLNVFRLPFVALIDE